MIQDTTFQRIRTQHVSKQGIEGPPEQETKTIEASPCAIDKWAQEATHRPKCKVGGPTGRPADLPMVPTALIQPCGDVSKAPNGSSPRIAASHPVTPCNKYKGGRD